MTNEKASLYISKKCKKKGVIVEMINEICTCIFIVKKSLKQHKSIKF